MHQGFEDFMSRSIGEATRVIHAGNTVLKLTSQAISHDAFRALVNLSDNSILAEALSEPSFLSFTARAWGLTGAEEDVGLGVDVVLLRDLDSSRAYT